MSDRTRALDVLREARETLARRLTELVLEQSEEILADARGESYMNEIESLYEQVGMKLAHLGQMISHLPSEIGEPTTATAAAHHSPEHSFTLATEPFASTDVPSTEADTGDALPALSGPIYVSAPALPPPGGAISSRVRATHASLQALAAQIQAGDLLAAGRTIGALFEIDQPRAFASAATFAQRVRSEASLFRRVLLLGSPAQVADEPRGLALLGECFGFSRVESQDVLRVLRRRLRLED